MFLSMFNMMFSAWPIPLYVIIEMDIFPGIEEQPDTDDPDPLSVFKGYDPPHLRQFIPNLYFPG